MPDSKGTDEGRRWPVVKMRRKFPGLPRAVHVTEARMHSEYETYVPVERLTPEEAKVALYEAHLRYQNVGPREQSEDGWEEALLTGVIAALDSIQTEVDSNGRS